MKCKTHLAFALLISVLFIKLADTIYDLAMMDKIVLLSLILFFSLFPDIDHPGSKLGRKVKPLSFLLNILAGHRGLMHGLIVPFFLFFIISFFGYRLYAIAVLIGGISHLVLDSLTKSGVRWFFPLKFRIKGPFVSGGIADSVLFFIFMALSVIAYYATNI